MKTPVLETIHLEERHTSEFLAKEIGKALGVWNICEKTVAIVHDNASNVANIAKKINEKYVDIPCAAHTLQLCIKAAMGTNTQTAQHIISRTINAASKLVGHFSHSALATSELMNKQHSMLLQPEGGGKYNRNNILIIIL